LMSEGFIPMDEHRTLTILSWIIGSLVTIVFVLSALALSMV
jgi:hypothetical protein